MVVKRTLIICFLILLIFKFCFLPYNITETDNHTESDIVHYIKISKKMIGEDIDLSSRNSQYPPVYPAFLVPGLFLGMQMYILLSNILLSALTFFPLYLFCRHLLKENIFAYLIPMFVISTNLVFTIKGYGFPLVFSTFLISWFLYLTLFVEKQRYLILSGLLFGLLIGTKYVFFYMMPFIILWLWFKFDNKKEWFVKMFIFFIPSFIAFICWSVFNFLSGKSSLAGYNGIFSGNSFLALHFSWSKIASFATGVEPNLVLIYFLIFLIAIALVFKKRDLQKWLGHNNKIFLILLCVNLVVFFIFPGMTWDISYFNYRYLLYFVPVYLSIGLCILVKEFTTKETHFCIL